MNYDKMGVRDLVREIVREEQLALDCGGTGDDWTTLKELESALRRRVIEEASVGAWRIGSGDYDLIPREPLVTPEELAYMKREIELHEDYELNVGKIPEIK